MNYRRWDTLPARKTALLPCHDEQTCHDELDSRHDCVQQRMTPAMPRSPYLMTGAHQRVWRVASVRLTAALQKCSLR